MSVMNLLKNLFTKVTKKLRLIQATVDVLCSDITKDINQQKYYVIDWDNGNKVNMHQNPQYGQKRNIYRAILGAVFPELRSHPLYTS